ncbi:MAG: S8 family serine peptidase [Bacteroidales bacterium]|nr:S8 family serine peptidase [Bacteroidales bacterium]
MHGGGIKLNAQSNNNEDKVVKIETYNRHASVPNQLLVKFNDGAGITLQDLRTSKQSNTKAQNTKGLKEVLEVLSAYDIKSVEQLLPNFKYNKERPRVSKSFVGTDVTEHDLSQLYLITLQQDASPQKNNFSLIEELKALELVDYAEPNYIQFALGFGQNNGTENQNAFADGTNNAISSAKDKTAVKTYTQGTPNDPMYSQQWGIPATHLNELWQKPKLQNAKRKVIAIIDTGVDIEHPDLKANIWTNEAEKNGAANTDDDGNGFKDDIHGWDFVNQTGDMHDFNSHGTHCAGIAAAVGDNGIGITGANPDALIMPVAVLQSNGTGDVATVIKGIHYAADNGADIISMSLGGGLYSIAQEQALAYAYQTAVIVASAGNDALHLDPKCCPLGPGHASMDQPLFPAAYSFVIGVQATKSYFDENNGYLADFSNIDCDGPTFSQYSEEQLYNYELSAPGVNIISTVPNGLYKSFQGTSMSCPLVAGGISVLLDRQQFASKELLLSNLIHWQDEFTSVNFIKVYDSINALPAQLQIVNYEINDTLYGDGSWYADAGERIQIYPTIRTVGAAADSITVWLEFQEYEDTTLFTFNSNHVALGHSLSSYAKAKGNNPIDITLKQNISDRRAIQLTMCAFSPKCKDTTRYDFTIFVTNGVKLNKILNGNDTLWPDVHYIVEKLGIPAGDTLVIMPGTVLKFNQNATWKCEGHVVSDGTPDSLITFTKRDMEAYDHWNSQFPFQKFSYCLFDYGNFFPSKAQLNNCIVRNTTQLYGVEGQASYTNIINGKISGSFNQSYTEYCNFANNYISPDCDNQYVTYIPDKFANISYSNILPYDLTRFEYIIYAYNGGIGTQTLDTMYYGSGSEKIVRQRVYDFDYPNSTVFTKIDLSKMAKRPFKEAHGIVWKVEVDGHDAQDEFDSIPPLGVGKHEFKVYFNRACDTAYTPIVAMGVRPPYTQTAIGENGSWSDDSTIYTCYKTLTGKDAIDGLNRIYVDGAKDDEHFEVPFENQRFNVYVESSGSMSAGFQATAGLGKVELEWNNQEMNVDDFLGFNMYRYQYNKMQITDEDTTWLPGDTVMINISLIVDTLFTDYDVVPGERYYYYYKILRTSLDENSPSKTVSSMPLSSIKGDANGSMSVDVADIITTINYVTNQNPQPFIFEAADVNDDGTIDVLDIVGIINIIMGNTTSSKAGNDVTALYFIENDTLFVDSPVPMAGVQFSFTTDKIQSLESLSQFEQIKQWTPEGNYMFMAYSLSGKKLPKGKTALIKLNGAEIKQIVLSDTSGKNIIPILASQQGLTDVMELQSAITQVYPNPSKDVFNITFAVGNKSVKTAVLTFSDVTGRVIGQKRFDIPSTGEYQYKWDASFMHNGIYFVQLRLDGMLAHTYKLIVNK